MIRWFAISYLFITIVAANSYGQTEPTPLRFLKDREIEHKEIKGETYLGKVMTLTYPAYAVEADNVYHPLILELTDVLKTPLRKNYRVVIKGYSDNSGPAQENMTLSAKRAEGLKKMLIEKYYMKEERITTEGYGEKDPVASNETSDGRRHNRRVEIHIYGDVSEAVKFIENRREHDERD